MATNFPTSLDTLGNPATNDTLNSPSHAGQHANANDAITALEVKVGINASAVTTTHDYKLSGVTGSDKAASKAGVETLTNKTLTGPTINSPSINEAVVLTTTATELNLLHGNLGAYGTWVPAYTGVSANPTTAQQYTQLGKRTDVTLQVSGVGVSNSVNKTITLPVAAKYAQSYICWQAQDAGTNLGGAIITTRAGSAIADLYKDFNATSWTGSGNWFVKFAFTYEAN